MQHVICINPSIFMGRHLLSTSTNYRPAIYELIFVGVFRSARKDSVMYGFLPRVGKNWRAAYSQINLHQPGATTFRLYL